MPRHPPIRRSAEKIVHPVDCLYASVLMPLEHRAEEAEAFGHARRGELVDRFRTVLIRRDGSRVAVQVGISPVIGPAGGIVGVATVSRDLSEQENHEAMFGGLLEAGPDAILGVDSEGRIALVNAEAERLSATRAMCCSACQ